MICKIYLLFITALCQVQVHVLGTAAPFDIICPNNVDEDISALAHFHTRGSLAQYYPFYKKNEHGESDKPTIPKLDATHYDRLEENIEFGRTEFVLDNGKIKIKGTKGAVDDAELFHYSAPVLKDALFVRWAARVVFPCTGVYQFATWGDDGLLMYLDGEEAVNDWTPHGARFKKPGTEYTITANSVRSVELIFFERGGHMAAEVWWLPPGGEWGVIPSKYMVPALQAEVLVTRHNVISVVGNPEIEYFEVRLSEAPPNTVYVDIHNYAGQDIFGVDKCVLVFTRDNWETPQRVHVAPILTVTSGRRISGDTMWIHLEPRDKAYKAAAVQVIEASYKADSEVFTRSQCVGWGAGHFRMFDGGVYSVHEQGMYALVRNYAGDMGVQVYKAPCDDQGADVSCAQLAYVVYDDTKIQLSMNAGNKLDDTVYVDTLAQDDEWVTMHRDDSDNSVTIVLPNGLTVKCAVGFAYTDRIKDTHWRYLNFYIEAPGFLRNQLTGLCGKYNHRTSHEFNAAQMTTKWKVPTSEYITGGGFAAMTQPGDNFDTTRNYAHPGGNVSLETFDWQSECNPNIVPQDIVSSPDPSQEITPPVEDVGFTPRTTDPSVDLAVEVECVKVINKQLCPDMDQTEVDAFVLACTIDTQVEQLSAPPAEYTLPFLEACTFATKSTHCASCTELQSCDLSNGTCSDTQANTCGAGCGTTAQGTCDSITAECNCTAEYTGKQCEILVDDCTPDPCDGVGTCSMYGLQPMCRCPFGVMKLHSCYDGTSCSSTAAGAGVTLTVFADCREVN